jgi:hypothetical protein
MNITDLSSSKELDSVAMADVRGGLQDFQVDTGALLGAVVSSNGGLGSPTIVTQVAPVISVITAIDLELPLSSFSL